MVTDGAHRRTYTDEEREGALALYVEHGPAEAGRRCGIPGPTIRKWAQRRGLTKERATSAAAAIEASNLTWAQRRVRVRDRWADIAEGYLERAAVTDSHQEGRNYVGAAAIATDKAQLLDGEPTARVASREEQIQRIKQVRDDLAGRRAEKAG